MKRFIACFELGVMILAVFAFSFILDASLVKGKSILSEPSVCCEKTKEGNYCINTGMDNCDSGFQTSPTSCETTSYCRLGTCYDSAEGICMENTPQNVCQEQGGTWDEREIEEVPQCQLGCCILGDQAAFVSLVRCKRLSSLFGLENEYRTDINDEMDCIATAQSQDEGACVYEKDFERICEFTTRKECGVNDLVENVNGTNVTLSSEKKFYENYLCSAEELNTICARQVSTTCEEGDVYWVDSCGNLENVYSGGSKEAKLNSWNNGRVAFAGEICPANDGSDVECGNCDYLLGTRCSEFEAFLDIGKPAGSDYYCQTTECVDSEGNDRKNGESWCVYDAAVGEGSDPAGSKHYKKTCVDGEVIVEPCAEFRNEICISGNVETDVGDFSTAACRVNRWQDCVAQTEQEDCENIDKRDCLWLNPVTGMVLGSGEEEGRFSNPSKDGERFSQGGERFDSSVTGNAIFGSDSEEEEVEETKTNRPGGICVPNFPPGFDFWEDGDAQGICKQASAKCVVRFEKGLISGEECVENCECLEEDWALSANEVCTSLGDCGGFVNYVGEYTEDGYIWNLDGEKKKFSPNNVNKISIAGTGNFWLAFIDWVLPLVFVRGYNVDQLIEEVEVSNSPGSNWLNFNMDSNSPSSNTRGGTKIRSLTNSPSNFGVKAGSNSLEGMTTSAAGLERFNAAKGTTTGAAGAGEVDVLFGLMKVQKASLTHGLMQGLQWGAIVGGLAYMAGGMFGLSKNNQAALGLAAGAGTATWQFLQTFKGTAGSWAGKYALPIGIGVGVAIFIAMYKKESVQIVEFNCQPWQSPVGGNDCEECNDEELDCSEYRCKSLGQACELVNKGSEEERCVYVNPRDTNPPIVTPNKRDLKEGYSYTNIKQNPPSPGFEIVRENGSNECIQAFEKLEFGISTDEPSQCRIDIKHTENFDDMANWFGNSNIYAYNHTEVLALPNSQDFENSTITLENGNEMNLFVRCRDKNGNTNAAEYLVNFCVDPSPDSTAPQIKATSVTNGGCIASDEDKANVDFYVNEPAECRWSKDNQDFDSMDNEMNCENNLYQINSLQLYTCSALLEGISRDETMFYVRCKDQPGKEEADRNENKQSYEFSLRGSTGLKMKNLQPNGTLFGAVNPAPVTLGVETLYGCEDGKSICYYSTTGEEGDYVMFFDTNNEDGISTQKQYLTAGKHKYYLKCVDSGGNVAIDSTSFDLDIDVNAPVIARVYEEGGNLKIVTVRKSECAYSFDDCDFTFQEGTNMPYANTTSHVAEWNKEKTYYIKCRDEFRNEEADCSMIVKPSDKLF